MVRRLWIMNGSDGKDKITRPFKVPTQHLLGDKVKAMGNITQPLHSNKQFSNVTCHSSRLIAGQRGTCVPPRFNFTYSLSVGSKKRVHIHLQSVHIPAYVHILYMYINLYMCRSQWSRGLRRSSAAARLLRSWVRIPPGAWMFVVSVVCCQVEVSATSWSLVQRSPTGCDASLCVI